MKRKLLTILTTVLLICFSSVFLFACGDDKHTHTITLWETITSPTCTTVGMVEGSCECGHIEQVYSPAVGHTFGAWETISATTCETSGLEKRTCACGHYETRTISATGHAFGAWKTEKTASCETDGLEKRTCFCNHYETRVIPALGHDFGEWTMVAEPTCETYGTEKRFCSCGHHEWKEIPIKEHAYAEDYSYNDKYHWRDSVCQHTLQGEFDEHSYSLLGNCVCGKKKNSDDVKVFAYVDGELYNTFYTNNKKDYKITPSNPEPDTTGNINSENYFYGWFVDENLNTPLTENTVFQKDSYIYGKWIDANSNNFSYEFENGKVILTAIEDKTAKVVVVPAYINSYPVYGIVSDVFAENNYLKTVIVCNGVQVLYDDCFAECTMLETVVLPESITTIGDESFYNCYNLKNINIPSKIKEICSSVFYNCQSLTEITIPENVEKIYSKAFYGTYALENIYFNATNCANLDSSNGAFAYTGKNALKTTVHVAKNVEYLPSYLFYNSNSTSSSYIDAVEFEKDSSLQLIGSYAFAYTKISKIDIPDTVTSIGSYAFSNCTLLQTVELPSSLITISTYAFNYCYLLTKITIPSSVTTIESYAFNDCSLLTNVKFDKTSGWSCYSYSSSTSGTSISSLTLANNSTAATYLTSTYESYYWRRG